LADRVDEDVVHLVDVPVPVDRRGHERVGYEVDALLRVAGPAGRGLLVPGGVGRVPGGRPGESRLVVWRGGPPAVGEGLPRGRPAGGWGVPGRVPRRARARAPPRPGGRGGGGA